MRATLLTAILVFTPLLVLGQAGGRSDQETMQGTWTWTSGDATVIFDTNAPTLRFRDTQLVVMTPAGDTEKTGKFEVFQGANPPEVVFTLLDVARNRKWQRKAAYDVSEKTLKLCFHKEPMSAPTCRTAAVVLDFRR